MKKYILYKLSKERKKNIKRYEIVGVEYGKDIYDVTEALIRDVVEDLTETPEYKSCKAIACAPEAISYSYSNAQYQYAMSGAVSFPHTNRKIVIKYGVVECTEDGK